MGFTNQGDLSALRDDVTCGKGKGSKGAKEKGGKGKTNNVILLLCYFLNSLTWNLI